VSQVILRRPPSIPFLVKDDGGDLQQKTGHPVQFELFSITWAMATLFHMANHRTFAETLPNVLLTISSILILVKPSSVGRLILLAIMQLFEMTLRMPGVSNHWIFTAFVNLTILQALVYVAFKQKSFYVKKDTLYNAFAPVVRIELLIIYFFVVFHKLNSAFFYTGSSCASNFFISQNSLSLFPQSTEILALSAYLTVGVEALIPLLLVFRKTRGAGIIIGLLFHCLIAYNPQNGFYDFSSMIFGTYIVFTSPSFSAQVYVYFRKIVRLKYRIKYRWASFSFSKLSFFVVCVGALFVMLFLAILNLDAGDFIRDIFWTSYSILFIFIFVASRRKQAPGVAGKSKSAFAIPAKAMIIMPMIVFVNGICPYLGLKTEHSFAMFSNLRTEGGISNHFLVPASSQLFDYQNDLVEIISSTDQMLSNYARLNQQMVYFSFRNHISNKKIERVEYIRNGQRRVFEFANPATHQDLRTRYPVWQRKLLRFRTIRKFDPQPCNH
jgi:hypothetical protein